MLQIRVVPKEALRTALVEVEGMLNSSITHVSCDKGDVEALTPNHFLLLRANPIYEEAYVSVREINSVKLWRRYQALVNFIWKRFIKVYIPSLTERKKWRVMRRNLKEGELALVT